MDKSKAFAVSATLLCLIGVDLVVQHRLIAALAMFVLAVGLAVKAHRTWTGNQA